MAKQYKALKPVGRFQVGDLVGGLSDEQIKKLIADCVIQEVKTAAATTKKATGDAK
ncbi:hypothetical protein [Acinetobacter towneri]|uniref:hypothetical protein n=1 Tax=Acinetobacter towneri TaxID=202956 RepID=UPI0002D0B631|nr:hypothetical protein [Acinetobacter towneri]ENV69781.1 hypothetical protein F947_01458 [Acinetobacter towneri DSM 14962 = CIP 107472]